MSLRAILSNQPMAEIDHMCAALSHLRNQSINAENGLLELINESALENNILFNQISKHERSKTRNTYVDPGHRQSSKTIEEIKQRIPEEFRKFGF
jgi:thiamine pyrophosphokinase